MHNYAYDQYANQKFNQLSGKKDNWTLRTDNSHDNVVRKQRSTKIRIQESKQKRSESQLSKVPYTSGKYNSQYDH